MRRNFKEGFDGMSPCRAIIKNRVSSELMGPDSAHLATINDMGRKRKALSLPSCMAYLGDNKSFKPGSRPDEAVWYSMGVKTSYGKNNKYCGMYNVKTQKCSDASFIIKGKGKSKRR